MNGPERLQVTALLSEGTPTDSERPRRDHRPLAVIEILLKTPASLLESLGERSGVHMRLAMIAVGGSMAAGLVAAAFSGGAQVWLLPRRMREGADPTGRISLGRPSP
jgi:hypothetical protein